MSYFIYRNAIHTVLLYTIYPEADGVSVSSTYTGYLVYLFSKVNSFDYNISDITWHVG